MNAFDKVIGYKSIKRELLQVCDMIRNRAIYEEMGARLPPMDCCCMAIRAWEKRFWQNALWKKAD